MDKAQIHFEKERLNANEGSVALVDKPVTIAKLIPKMELVSFVFWNALI